MRVECKEGIIGQWLAEHKEGIVGPPFKRIPPRIDFSTWPDEYGRAFS